VGTAATMVCKIQAKKMMVMVPICVVMTGVRDHPRSPMTRGKPRVERAISPMWRGWTLGVSPWSASWFFLFVKAGSQFGKPDQTNQETRHNER
jgi:hypothetical protein